MPARPWVALVLVVPVACVAPARTTSDYAGKAASTAEVVLASVETAALVIDATRLEDAFGPYVAVTLSDAEGDAASASGTFRSLQPPDEASDAIREELVRMLDDASELLVRARIAARRERVEELTRAEPPLVAIAAELEGFVRRYG